MASTSPAAEPGHFCASLRATLRRMMNNPQPLITLFPGGQARLYRLEHSGAGWDWVLLGPDLADTQSGDRRNTWGFRDFKMAFM